MRTPAPDLRLELAHRLYREGGRMNLEHRLAMATIDQCLPDLEAHRQGQRIAGPAAYNAEREARHARIEGHHRSARNERPAVDDAGREARAARVENPDLNIALREARLARIEEYFREHAPARDERPTRPAKNNAGAPPNREIPPARDERPAVNNAGVQAQPNLEAPPAYEGRRMDFQRWAGRVDANIADLNRAVDAVALLIVPMMEVLVEIGEIVDPE